MVEKSGRPAYLQIVDELSEQIRTGSLPPGAALPSIAQLCERFDVSASVVKSAISVLRTQGLVIGQQGKGVFVHQAPAATPEPQPAGDTGEILGQLAAMRESLKDLGDRLAALESAVFQERK